MAPRAAPPRLAKLHASLLWHEADLEAPSPAPSPASGARIRRTAGRDLGREADLFSGEMLATANHSPSGGSVDRCPSSGVADDGGQVLLCDAVSAEEALSLGLSPAGDFERLSLGLSERQGKGLLRGEALPPLLAGRDSRPGPQGPVRGLGRQHPNPHTTPVAQGTGFGGPGSAAPGFGDPGFGGPALAVAGLGPDKICSDTLESWGSLPGDWGQLVWGGAPELRAPEPRAPEPRAPGRGRPESTRVAGLTQREMARTRTEGEIPGYQGKMVRTNQGDTLYIPTAGMTCQPWGHENMTRRASCPDHLDNSSRVYGAQPHRPTAPGGVAVKGGEALSPVGGERNRGPVPDCGVQARRSSPGATHGPYSLESIVPLGQTSSTPAGRRLQRSLSGDSEGEGPAPSAGQQQRGRANEAAGEGTTVAAPRPGRLQRSMSGDEEGTDGRRSVQSKTPRAMAAPGPEDWVPVRQVPVLELPVRRGARLQRSMDQDSEEEDGARTGREEQRRGQTAKAVARPTRPAQARIQNLEGGSTPRAEGKSMLNTRRVAVKCPGDAQDKVKASPRAAQRQVQKANEVLTPRGSGFTHTRVSPRAQPGMKKLERSLSGDSLGGKEVSRDCPEDKLVGSPDKQTKFTARLAVFLPLQLRSEASIDSPARKTVHARTEKAPRRTLLHGLKLEHQGEFSPRTPNATKRVVM